MEQFIARLRGAAAMDVPTYEAVEHDENATLQAVAVVVMSAIAMGIGSAPDGGLLVHCLQALLLWVLWAAVIWLVGSKLLPEPQTDADISQLMRTLGFAAAPGLLGIFGIIPLLGGLILLAAHIWMICTMVVAVRQALDYRGTGRAIAVVIVGWIPYLVIAGIVT